MTGGKHTYGDVLTGRDVVIREQRASGMVQPGALLFTRVLSVEDTAIMSGYAPLVIPPDWHLPLLDARDRAAGGKGRHLSRERLHELDGSSVCADTGQNPARRLSTRSCNSDDCVVVGDASPRTRRASALPA